MRRIGRVGRVAERLRAKLDAVCFDHPLDHDASSQRDEAPTSTTSKPELDPSPVSGRLVGRCPLRRVSVLDMDDDYTLGRSDAETQRLILQHQIYGPLTRQFLVGAGVGVG